MNFQEILEELEKQDITIEDFGRGYGLANPVPNIGPWVEVHKEGGEDQGSHWEVVRHFTDHDIYIRVVAWYSSYNGIDFGDSEYEEVKPQQKTITVYE